MRSMIIVQSEERTVMAVCFTEVTLTYEHGALRQNGTCYVFPFHSDTTVMNNFTIFSLHCVKRSSKVWQVIRATYHTWVESLNAMQCLQLAGSCFTQHSGNRSSENTKSLIQLMHCSLKQLNKGLKKNNGIMGKIVRMWHICNIRCKLCNYT